MRTQVSKMRTPTRRATKTVGYASGTQRHVLRRKLQREKAAHLSTYVGLVTPVPDGAACGDPLDRAIVGADYDLTVELKARRWKALQSVNGAMQRLGTRRYGMCEDCYSKIPAKRLRVRPDATRCVQCQARHEESSARRGFTSLQGARRL